MLSKSNRAKCYDAATCRRLHTKAQLVTRAIGHRLLISSRHDDDR